eukprot:197441_1
MSSKFGNRMVIRRFGCCWNKSYLDKVSSGCISIYHIPLHPKFKRIFGNRSMIVIHPPINVTLVDSVSGLLFESMESVSDTFSQSLDGGSTVAKSVHSFGNFSMSRFSDLSVEIQLKLNHTEVSTSSDNSLVFLTISHFGCYDLSEGLSGSFSPLFLRLSISEDHSRVALLSGFEKNRRNFLVDVPAAEEYLSAPLDPMEWAYLVINIKSPNTVELYVNGALVGRNTDFGNFIETMQMNCSASEETVYTVHVGGPSFSEDCPPYLSSPNFCFENPGTYPQYALPGFRDIEFPGWIGELRISRFLRPSNWYSLQYLMMKQEFLVEQINTTNNNSNTSAFCLKLSAGNSLMMAEVAPFPDPADGYPVDIRVNVYDTTGAIPSLECVDTLAVVTVTLTYMNSDDTDSIVWTASWSNSNVFTVLKHVPGLVGQYEIRSFLFNSTVSATHVFITPYIASAPESQLLTQGNTAGLNGLTLHSPDSVTVTMRDVFGNFLTFGGNSLSMEITPLTLDTFPADLSFQITDLSDGNYTVYFASENAGSSFKVLVMLNNTQIDSRYPDGILVFGPPIDFSPIAPTPSSPEEPTPPTTTLSP